MNQKFLLPLLILVLVVLAGVLWAVLGEGSDSPIDGLEYAESASHSSAGDGQGGLPDSGSLSEPLRIDKDLSTTVVLPLQLDFEIVDAKARLDDDGSPALGSAATARLRGSIHGADGRGIAGYAEFLAGPNKGRVLDANSEGYFGVNDLVAGLSLVALRGPGVPGAEREVLLREKREAQLNVGFGRLATVRGTVKDGQNNPLPTATVVVDGQETQTDQNGQYYFAGIASGKVPVYVMKPGYASHREMQYITAGMSIPLGKLKYTLRKAATLKVVIPERVGTGRPGQLFITGPLNGTGARNYPWHLKSPISMYGGESIEIEDLAPGPVRLQYFRAGALAEPAVIKETLFAGKTTTVTFHLKAAPILAGVVKSGDKPVEGVLVRLEAPDTTGASVAAIGERFGRATLEMGLLSQMPPSMQSFKTGADGKFQFSAAEKLAPVRYLTAKTADGKAWGGLIVRPGDVEVEVQLKEALHGGAGFLIETSTRFQALPVRYVVNGKPTDVLLAPGERLEIPGLAEGKWKFSSNWGGELIQTDIAIDLSGTEEIFVPLPKGAIQGQAKSLRDAMQ